MANGTIPFAHTLLPLPFSLFRRELLEVARGSRLDALLLVAMTTAMRRGELVALRWSDVDLERGVLQIRHTLSRVPAMGYVEGEPKTKKGRRRILFPGVVVAALKEHKA